MHKRIKAVLAASASIVWLTGTAAAKDFNIPDGDLGTALNAYMAQSGAALVISLDAVKGVRTRGVKGDLSPDAALTRLLSGTGFTTQHDSGVIAIVRQQSSSSVERVQPLLLAQAAPSSRAAVETVTVTSSKLGGADVQSIPIAITALSQEQLTATQTAGGPDLETGAKSDIHQNEFHGLQHPDSRHRHTSHLGHYGSGCGGRLQRHAVHPQSFLRTGIL